MHYLSTEVAKKILLMVISDHGFYCKVVKIV